MDTKTLDGFGRLAAQSSEGGKRAPVLDNNTLALGAIAAAEAAFMVAARNMGEIEGLDVHINAIERSMVAISKILRKRAQ